MTEEVYVLGTYVKATIMLETIAFTTHEYNIPFSFFVGQLFKNKCVMLLVWWHIVTISSIGTSPQMDVG